MVVVITYTGEDRDQLTYLIPTLFAPAVSPYARDISARNYYEYAKIDFCEGSTRGLINALGNAKRALHLVVDCTLHAYGLLYHNARCQFPSKLEMLDAAGLLPISILRQLNLERNVMEHEYGAPTKQRVSEAIDVAQLLLLACRKIWEWVTYECVVGLSEPEGTHALMRLYPDQGVIRFFRLSAPLECFYKQDGVDVFRRHVRTSGDIPGDVTYELQPLREINLRYANREEWRSVVSELVRIDPTAGIESSEEVPRAPIGGYLTLPVTIPISDDAGASLVDLMIEQFGSVPDRLHRSYSELPGIPGGGSARE